MRSFSLVLLFCSTVACAGVLAQTARAQTASAPSPAAPVPPGAEDADARRAFEAGRDAYDHGAFAAALAHYERAYALSRRPGLLFNIGRAADSDGQAKRARIAYEAYLDAVPAAENVDFVRARLARVREAEAAQAAVAPPASPPAAPEPAPPAAEPLASASPEPAPVADPAPIPLPSVAATTTSQAAAPARTLLTSAEPRRDHSPPPSRRKRALLWTALSVLVAGGVAGGAVALAHGRAPARATGDGYYVVPEGP